MTNTFSSILTGLRVSVVLKMAASGKTLLTFEVLPLHVARCQGSTGNGKDSSLLRLTLHLYSSTISENNALLDGSVVGNQIASWVMTTTFSKQRL